MKANEAFLPADRRFRLPIFFLLLFSSLAQAVHWDIATVFLGAEEDETFQSDVDSNILELARLSPGDSYRLSLYRELRGRQVAYFADRNSLELHPWDALFFKSPVAGVEVPGRLREQVSMDSFLKEAFKDRAAHRILILYGHGFAHNGLRKLPLTSLQERLSKVLPTRAGEKPLDILWLDACFMASLEVAYELRGLSRYYVSSEDAEFSAGMPFEGLRLLENENSSVEEIALSLARGFVQSYSYLEEGSQRRAVFASSATISVVDSEKIEALALNMAALVKTFGGKLTEGQRLRMKNSRARRKTERADIVDLSAFVSGLKGLGSTPKAAREAAEAVLMLLDFHRPGKQSTARVALRPPSPDARLVFGYEQWSRGDQRDSEVLERLPEELKTTDFTQGPLGLSWPTVTSTAKKLLAPFLPGMRRFDYYFIGAEGEVLSEQQGLVRTQDFVVFEASSEHNPLRLTAYTQGIGSEAERYSGLGILDPTAESFTPAYGKTAFSKLSHWGNL